eukprot:6203537-Pleurochrysis_carterae.AAC.2
MGPIRSPTVLARKRRQLRSNRDETRTRESADEISRRSVGDVSEAGSQTTSPSLPLLRRGLRVFVCLRASVSRSARSATALPRPQQQQRMHTPSTKAQSSAAAVASAGSMLNSTPDAHARNRPIRRCTGKLKECVPAGGFLVCAGVERAAVGG